MNKINTDLIMAYLVKNKISKTRFCKQNKISLKTFNKILSGDLNFGVTKLLKIAYILDVEFIDLLK